MQSNDWNKIRELFDSISRQPKESRQRALAELCPDDPDLQAEVLSLIEYEERAGPGFLTPSSVSKPGANSPDPFIGRRIHKYQIIDAIAYGGMGAVYRAQQDNPARIVALKLMRAGFDSSSAKRRFEYETQVLARLRHPKIAQIFEAGTFNPSRDGEGVGPALPYFVMELVPEAKKITQYARDANLESRKRIELFLQACDAVQHGHQRGVMHRDIKPANILVDSTESVKLIDFGVAKATDSDVAATTLRTDVGQMVGTIQYMSPEQCEADPLSLDVRTDVYSLGVVLYELLCDQLPYDVSSLPLPSAARSVCETIPARPSAVARSLRSDLELVLLKALEKDRAQRYQSVADLARDLRHYLNREPIEARKPSVAARIKFLTRRHALAVTAISSCCLGLMILSASLYVSRRTILAEKSSIEEEIRQMHRRPDRLQTSDDMREVSLVSASGRILHTWRGQQDGVFSAAQMKAFGYRRVVFLSGAPITGSDFMGSLSAFDADASQYETPLWSSAIEPQDLPREPAEGLRSEDFGPGKILGFFDVFPEVPGEELVVTYFHYRSRRALRVLSANGDVLWQVWHDGGINAAQWLEQAKLLVFAGSNDEVPWPDRGGPKTSRGYYPWVVWAVRPTIWARTNQYICTGKYGNCVSPAWYRCVMPESSTDIFAAIHLDAPQPGQDDGMHLLLTLDYELGPHPPRAGWLIDSLGEIPQPAILDRNDAYLMAEKSLHPIREFRLEDFSLITTLHPQRATDVRCP